MRRIVASVIDSQKLFEDRGIHMYWVMWLILIPTFLTLALGLLGIDRANTLSANPLAWAIIGVCAVAVFVISLRAYLANKEPPDKIERLKRDSKLGWIAVGAVAAVLFSGWFCFVVYQIVQIAAQYLPGAHRQVAGEVRAVHLLRGRGTCRSYATVALLPGKDEVRFCMRVNLRAAIGPLDIEPAQHVSLQLKDTLLGTVVLAFQRDD
jgi:hypothetical protein